MKKTKIKRLVLHVLFGQAVALLNSLTGVTTTKLVENDASYPLLQSLTAYAFIFIVYSAIFLFLYLRHRGEKFSNFTFLRQPWRYALLGLIDMEANFVVVKAYQYTDMISVQLLGCFNIPCVLILSTILLKMRFAFTHIFGCAIATGGLVLLVVLDADGVTRDSVGPNVVKGDLFCLLAAALYATSNVVTEWFIKPKAKIDQIANIEHIVVNQQEEEREEEEGKKNNEKEGEGENSGNANGTTCHRETEGGNENGNDNTLSAFKSNLVMEKGGKEENEKCLPNNMPEESSIPSVPKYIPLVENLFCMSGFALVFATIQFFAVEWKSFSTGRKTWTKEDTLYQMMFGLSMVFVYTGLPTLFLVASAVFANVSLLSVSVYSIIWNVAIFDIHPTPVFFASYVIIITGILLYDLSDIHWSWCPRINYPCGDPRDVPDATCEPLSLHSDAANKNERGEMETLPNTENIISNNQSNKG